VLPSGEMHLVNTTVGGADSGVRRALPGISRLCSDWRTSSLLVRKTRFLQRNDTWRTASARDGGSVVRRTSVGISGETRGPGRLLGSFGIDAPRGTDGGAYRGTADGTAGGGARCAPACTSRAPSGGCRRPAATFGRQQCPRCRATKRVQSSRFRVA